MLRALLTALILVATSHHALAHGPQLQITQEGGRIATRHVLTNDYFPLTGEKSVYVMPLLQRPLDDAWYTRPELSELIPGAPDFYSGPGLAFGLGQTFDVGAELTWGYTEGLRVWDGGAFVGAGQVDLESFAGDPEQTARASDPAGAIALAPIGPVGAGHGGYNDQSHATIRHRLLVGGSAGVAAPDGVYLATLSVAAESGSTLVESAPFHFLLHKNAPQGEVALALGALGVDPSAVQFLGVPEPGALLLLAGGLAPLLGARRRRGG